MLSHKIVGALCKEKPSSQRTIYSQMVLVAEEASDLYSALVEEHATMFFFFIELHEIR